MQLSIIIVNYNVKYFLEQCLCSVNKAIQHLEAEVWVVDNASSDNSAAYLKERFPGVKFIVNVKNAGFAKANNHALLQSSGKYVLFLNPDTLIPEDSLIKCIAFMQANKQAGALGVRMIDGSGTFLPESKRSFPSPLASFYKLTGVSGLFPASAVFSRYSLTYLHEFKNHEVDVLSGAFMLAKRSLLIQLEGFDEDFFMYGEDIDLSYRIQKSGHKNYYFSEVTIIHFKGESTGKKNVKYVKMFYQAMSIFVKKHYSGKPAFLSSSILQAAIWLRAGVSALLQPGLEIKHFLFNKVFITSFNKKRNESSWRPGTLIAGTEKEFEEVKNLLADAGAEEKITGWVSTGEHKENALGVITELNSLVKNFQPKQIIFCAGELSYSRIITEIQKSGKKVSLLFHAYQTESIVGSDSKNAAGKIISTGSNGKAHHYTIHN